MRLVPLLLTLAVGGCYQIDADVSGLTSDAGLESFVAAGPLAGHREQTTRLLSFNTSSSLLSTLRTARIDTVTLTPKSGVTSLDFLNQLTLVLHGTSGDVPLVDAAGKMVASDGKVTLPIDLSIDPTLLSAPLKVDATIGFVAPATAWSLDISAALTVSGHLDVKI